MSQTPEQIADQMLAHMTNPPVEYSPSDVWPFLAGSIEAIVESDRSDAECREQIRATLAAADIVRQRLIERRRAPKVTPRIDTEEAARAAFVHIEDDDNEWGGA